VGDFLRGFGDSDDPPGFISGAARVLIGEVDDKRFKEVGKVAKSGITVAVNNADNEFDVDSVALNPLAQLTKWQRELSAHVHFADDQFFYDVLHGKPRQLNKFQMIVSYEHGDKDPFSVMPDDAHTWRGAWRWIKDCFWYPIGLALGRFKPPYRTIYIINNLELADIPIELPSFTLAKESQEWDRSQEAFRRHFRFTTMI
jgi:hypothetical protein